MASVYILYSKSINSFYTGSCKDLTYRLEQHLKHSFITGFTRRATDWKVFFQLDNLDFEQARKIERHIKSMKSTNYLKNLKLYPEISSKLIQKYSTGSCR